MNKNLGVKIVIIFILVASFGFLAYFIGKNYRPEFSPGNGIFSKKTTIAKDEIKPFSSEKDFKEYLTKGKMNETGLGMSGGIMNAQRDMSVSEKSAPMETALPSSSSFSGESPKRFSETNVQVLGIDEPDIAKTDGQDIYFSSERFWSEPIMMDKRAPVESETSVKSIMPPYEPQAETKIFKAFPPAELSKIGSIQKNGNLLLKGDILVIFSGRSIIGYDVKDPKDPKEKWKIDLKDNNQLVASRLVEDKIYAVTSNNINSYKPCPIEVYLVKGQSFPIRCDRIYHPVSPIQADVTYTIVKIDVGSGDILDDKSFVGSIGNSTVYMSRENIYVTYAYPGNFVAYLYGFFRENSDLLPEDLINRLGKLDGYDISSSAKMTELTMIIGNYQNSLTNDERLKTENELKNRMENYAKDHRRDLEMTGIVKINAENLNIDSNGSVPGKILNQFSLDEYKNNLRVATTVGGNFWWEFGGGSGNTANDVYVLDKDMKEAGSVKDLAAGERIYSVRFLEDKGYVVTFKQVDPFFVLDLSDPKKPEQKGELKIPGYSSYLHPIDKDRIIGVGMENGQVKISLFDVAKPESPQELSKYNLDEYWTDVSNTHHAFLMDKKHEVFFLPGGKGGYIFSYENNKLNLKKAVSDTQTKRALYINDYLYVIGENKITVLNEADWEKVKEMEL